MAPSGAGYLRLHTRGVDTFFARVIKKVGSAANQAELYAIMTLGSTRHIGFSFVRCLQPHVG